MLNKRLIPVAALLLLGGGALALGMGAGAAPPPGADIPAPAGAIVESPNARSNVSAARPAVPQAPGLPAATDSVAFNADFSTDNLASWKPLGLAPGTWVSRDSRLQQRGDATGELGSDNSVLLIKDLQFSDGKLEAQVFPTSGEPVGLVFRGSDAGYYRVSLYPSNPNAFAKAYLERVTADGVYEVASAPVSTWAGLTLSQWEQVTVSTQGDRIAVSVGGTEIIGATDSTYTSGWAGVWTVADMGAQFDNVRVQQAAGR